MSEPSVPPETVPPETVPPATMPPETAPPETAPPETADTRPTSTRTGPGRLLVAVYGLFALSATARAVVQIATKFSHAPVAYLLSAFAGVVYIVATVTLGNGSPVARRIAIASCSVEFAGVVAVGTWSLLDKATFPDATVWSGYGTGYGYVPLVLPLFGLLWLRYWSRRTRAAPTPAPEPAPEAPAPEAPAPQPPATQA
jgi:hypothetical protein